MWTEKVRDVAEEASVQFRLPLSLHPQSAQKLALHETGVLTSRHDFTPASV